MEWESNFHAENSCDLRQLETEVKNEVAYKKNMYLGSSPKWVQVLKMDSSALVVVTKSNQKFYYDQTYGLQ